MTGVTTIEVNVAGVTVSTAEPVIEAYETVIVACPGAIPVARPFASTPAIEAGDDIQDNPAFNGCMLPSL
jgi:hypothetical protein